MLLVIGLDGSERCEHDVNHEYAEAHHYSMVQEYRLRFHHFLTSSIVMFGIPLFMPLFLILSCPVPDKKALPYMSMFVYSSRMNVGNVFGTPATNRPKVEDTMRVCSIMSRLSSTSG